MATPTWGLLAKSAVDSEKIEEAIARLIAEHNDNEDSHLEVGQSLQSHKAAAIIDHLAGSIIEDKIGDGQISLIKLTETKFIIMSCFESLEGWLDNSDPGATVQAGVGAGFLVTPATIDKTAILAALPSAPSMSGGVNFSKNPFFQVRAYIPATTHQNIYLYSGNASFPTGPPTTKYFGFRVSNGVLFAVVSNGVYEWYSTITGITLAAKNLYRAVMTSGVNIKFYVNGVLKVTRSSSLPTGEEDSILAFMIKTSDNVERELDLVDTLFSQDY